MITFVDYSYYLDFFGETAIIPAKTFDQIARESSAFINEITFGRIGEEVTDDIKAATCEVCNVIYTERERTRNTNGREVQSENTDGYSVTYVVDKEGSREEMLWKKKYYAARPYLIHTGLLQRGCY